MSDEFIAEKFEKEIEPEIRKFEKKATEGPWIAYYGYDGLSSDISSLDGDCIVDTNTGGFAIKKQDAEFIARARYWVPLMLEHIEHLRKQNKEFAEALVRCAKG